MQTGHYNNNNNNNNNNNTALCCKKCETSDNCSRLSRSANYATLDISCDVQVKVWRK